VNDQRLIQEFIRVEEQLREIRIYVRMIRWSGPCTPISEWVIAKTCPLGTSSVVIEEDIMKLLVDQRFFGVCEECHDRKPSGRMHGTTLCQSCASQNHGVVY
jgi:hypothetical protein